jgi:secreted trypsin-like serine protease
MVGTFGSGMAVGVLAVTTGLPAGYAAEEIDSAELAIIGGESADVGEYPATGVLMRGLSPRCTATLIEPDVIVTAAHCLVDEGFGDFGFTLDPNLRDGLDGELVGVLAHHQHPDFDPDADGEEYNDLNQRNDIGIVILAEPIDVEVEELDAQRPGARAADLRGGGELTVVGYGRDGWSSPATAGVKRDGVVLVERADTWELKTTGQDPQPCRGDSGGPLFAESDDGRRIVGLVSRATAGSRMCDTGAIYTRVAPYSEWIAEASLDRDTGGCAVGGGPSTWLPALLGWLLVAARRRPRARSTGAPAE